MGTGSGLNPLLLGGLVGSTVELDTPADAESTVELDTPADVESTVELEAPANAELAVVTWPEGPAWVTAEGVSDTGGLGEVDTAVTLAPLAEEGDPAALPAVVDGDSGMPGLLAASPEPPNRDDGDPVGAPMRGDPRGEPGLGEAVDVGKRGEAAGEKPAIREGVPPRKGVVPKVRAWLFLASRSAFC